MSATKITKPAHLRSGLDKAADDALKAASSLHLQRIEQGVGSFANRDDRDTSKGIEIVEILADAQHAAFTINVSLESFIDAGFRQSVLEKLPGSDTHLDGCTLAISGRGHGAGL